MGRGRAADTRTNPRDCAYPLSTQFHVATCAKVPIRCQINEAADLCDDRTDLTRNVYRWTPTRHGASAGVHTIDERIDMNAHMEAVKFYYNFVRNLDASDA